MAVNKAWVLVYFTTLDICENLEISSKFARAMPNDLREYLIPENSLLSKF